jgi:hypothetical protein
MPVPVETVTPVAVVENKGQVQIKRDKPVIMLSR